MRENVTISLVDAGVGDAEVAAVERVLRSGQLAAGPEVQQFEREFAATCSASYAVAVNSGTAALHCALEAAGVGSGDEVVTTPFTFAATATPILMQGARPRFVDIDPRTFNADCAALAQGVTARTRAAIVVDLFGLPAALDGRADLRERGVAIVEDACQAIGARRAERPVGAGGEAVCFSLYATKNIIAGEGGVLTTDDPAIAAAAKRFRQHGQDERYNYQTLGYNYRMTDIAAAIARVQLGRLALVTARRRENAHGYDAALAGVPGIATPMAPAGLQHAYHQYSVTVDPSQTPNGADRDSVRAVLSAAGIATGIYYPTPLHLTPLFANLGCGPGSFPVAERVARQILALPIHPKIGAEHIAHVSSALRRAVGYDA